MTQTITPITACDVGIKISDATGAMRDISGSANKLTFSGDIPTAKKYVLGYAWPRRYQGGKDASIKCDVVYSTAAAEGWDVLKAWAFAPVPGIRLVSFTTPDGLDLVANVSDVSFEAPAGDGGPVIVSFTLRPASLRPASLPKWWLANDTIPEANCRVAYSPYGAASLAASYINLAHPGVDDAVKPRSYNAPSLDALLGWVFNGVNTCLHSFSDITGADWSMIVSYATPTSTGRRTVAGKYHSNSNRWAIAVDWKSDEMWAWHGYRLETAPILTSGTYGIAANLAYRNGSPEAGTITYPNSQPSNPFYIGALGAGTIGLEFWPGSIKRIAVYDITLTPAQMAVLHAEMV